MTGSLSGSIGFLGVGGNSADVNWLCIVTSDEQTAPEIKLERQAKGKTDTKAKLTLVERGLEGEHPWVMFTIEAPEFNTDPKPESQLWYAIAGKQAVYTSCRAIKQAAIPEDLRAKWTAFYRSAKITNEPAKPPCGFRHSFGIPVSGFVISHPQPPADSLTTPVADDPTATPGLAPIKSPLFPPSHERTQNSRRTRCDVRHRAPPPLLCPRDGHGDPPHLAGCSVCLRTSGGKRLLL